MIARGYPRPPSQRGVALLIVLWGCTLAAITLGALASQARVEGIQAQGQSRRTEAFYAAEAGIELAVYRLQAKDPAMRWRADGRSYDMESAGARIRISISDEDGRINLNMATPEQIEGVLRAASLDEGTVSAAARAIVGWGKRGKGKLRSGLTQGGFTSLEELYRVPGLDVRVARLIEPAFSLWSPQEPNLAHASPMVVSAVTGADDVAATDFVGKVRAMGPVDTAFPPVPGESTGKLAITTSGVFTIESKASIKGGQALTLNVTLLLKSEPGDPRAYRVVRWRELASTGDS